MGRRRHATSRIEPTLDGLSSTIEAAIAASGGGASQISTLTLPESPTEGQSVSVLADTETVIPEGITWDSGGEPTVTGRLLITFVWSGVDWVGTYGVAIPPLPDAEAPTTPTGLTAAASGATSVLLEWSASTDNVAVSGYEYRVDGGTAVDAGAGLSESVTGLTAETEYDFEVRAYDAAGNRSGWSTVATETTDPGVEVMDSFNRANNASTLGTADTGQTWTYANSTWGISSNHATMTVGNLVRGHASVEVGSADMLVTATVYGTALQDAFPWVVARYVDPDNCYAVQTGQETATGRTKLVRRIGAAQDALATILDEASFPDGTVVGLSTVEEGGGTRIIVTADGVEVANYLDSTSGRPAGTKAGLFGYKANASTYFDSFSADVIA